MLTSIPASWQATGEGVGLAVHEMLISTPGEGPWIGCMQGIKIMHGDGELVKPDRSHLPDLRVLSEGFSAASRQTASWTAGHFQQHPHLNAPWVLA